MKINSHFLLILLLGIAPKFASADSGLDISPPQEAGSLILQILTAQERYFQAIQSFKEVSKSSFVVNPEEVANYNILKFTSTLTYIAHDNLYWFELKTQNEDGKPYAWYQNAFDGDQYSTLNVNTTEMMISKKSTSMKYPLLTVRRNALFEPFCFLSQNKYDVMWLTELRDPQFWRNALAKCRLIKTDSKSTLSSCAEFQIPGPTVLVDNDDIKSSETIFTVDFATDMGFFPIKWSWQKKDGTKIAEYEVSKIGRAKPSDPNQPVIFVPLEAHRLSYIHGHLGDSDQIILESLDLGSKFDNSIFTIDPSQARTIYDLDNNVTIQVPK